MRVINQLINHFRWSAAMTPELLERLRELGFMETELDYDGYDGDYSCDYCRNRPCLCDDWRAAVDPDDDWLAVDRARRQRASRSLRGKRGRRREATADDVRQAIERQFDKWSLPGGRLQHLVEVGNLLTPCANWQRAARALLSLPVSRLVVDLDRGVRHSVRPLFNRLDDFDLVLRSFSRPWRGQAGAALRRLVDQRPDKRSHKLLRFSEFRDVALLVELAGHLKQARRHIEVQARPRLRQRPQSTTIV